MINIEENIKKCLLNWNFDLVEKFYCKYTNDEFMQKYVMYLFYTGQLRKIFENITLKQIFKNTISHRISKNCFKDVEKILLDDVDNLNINNYNVPQEVLGCYILIEIIDRVSYEPEKVLWIFKNYLIASDIKISSYKIPKQADEKLLAKKFFIAKSIDFFESFEQNSFFEKSGSILSIIQWFFPSEYGAKKYYIKYSNRFKKTISHQEINLSNNPKVAVCISGAMRGDFLKPINQIVENIVKPLNADVFIFSWDEHLKWPGICGGSNWVARLLESRFNSIAPEEIKNNHSFKQFFKNTYQKLAQEYCDVLDCEKLKYIYNCKKVLLENQEAFIKQSGLKDYSYTATKLYYGCFKVFELMQNYEKEQNIKYDFVIRIRPDCNFPEIIKYEDLFRLNTNEVYIAHHLHMDGRVSDSFSCGRRNSMEKLLSMWKLAPFNRQMIEFTSFPSKFDIETHMLLFRWLIVNDLIANHNFPYPLLGGSSTIIKEIPNILQEIKEDIKELEKNGTFNDDKLRSFNEFFNQVIKAYPTINTNNQTNILGAKIHIQNHLSYKLGSALIANSKSLLGYIKMPYILMAISIAHKEQNKNLKLAKDKLPPLESYADYQEALKEKECFTYKLGKAFIKAHKNWYGGGVYQILLPRCA